jgi:tetratricopeptide (TPR) repeat protein
MTGSSDTERQRIAAVLQRTHLLAVRDREEDALELLREPLAASPDHPDLLARRAWLLNRLWRPEVALDSAEAALRVAPHHASALMQVSNAALSLRDFERAEEVLLRMLELWPHDDMTHRQLAVVLAYSCGDAGSNTPLSDGERGNRRARAMTHIAKALELDPHDPENYRVAARVASVFGEDREQALRYADQGLALVPENLELLQLRAQLVEEATAASDVRNSEEASHRLAVAEADRILRLDPGNEYARQRLFGLFWRYRTSLVDAPLIGLALLLAGAACLFVVDTVSIVFFLPGLILALLSTLMRLVSYHEIAKPINQRFLRGAIHDTPFAKLRMVLGGTAWTIMILAAVALTFMRDAVLVRWTVVALGGAVIAALGASLIWQLGYTEASRRIGGATESSLSISFAADHRAQSRVRVALRALVAVAAVLFLVGPGFRSDTISVMQMAFAATLLPPLVAVLVAGRAERRRVAVQPEDSVVRRVHRPQSVKNSVLTGLLAVAVAVVVALRLAVLPVLPNEYDSIGSYRLPEVADELRFVPPAPAAPAHEPIELPTFEPPPVVVTPVP